MVDITKELEKKFPTFKTTPSIFKKSVINIAKKLIHEDVINEFLEKNSHLNGFEFVDAVLDYFDFDYSINSNEIENIPPTGRVVIISNHPLGALDALSLLKLVSNVRKDVKIVANDFLAGFDAIENQVIHIDNFKSKQSKSSIKKVYDALNNDEAVIIFPAGEVSRISPKGIKDGKWYKGFLKFAKNTNSPILPILIDAKNSKTFYTVSALNKTFSTILLSDEMFKQQSKKINIKIGELIANEHIAPIGISRDYLPTLYKNHLYALRKNGSFFVTQNAIAHPEDRKELKNALKNSERLGQTADGKHILLYDYEPDSIVLKELGRLREVSFRRVGEGVNKKRDIDKFDKYYQHIIVWDEDELEIVGAYRIGNSDYIMENYGIEGLYTSTLYTFHESITPYLKNSIELGRSFVQPKYWGTRALDYLWYGIGAYLNKNPEIKYMFGPVSISATYPKMAKDLLVYFYSNYFRASQTYVTPNLSYTYSTDIEEMVDLFNLEDYKQDFKALKSTLSNLGVTVPTLYKQYSDICEEGGVQFLGFNIDVEFNDSVDGFIMTDVSKIKETPRQRYILSHNKTNS